MNGTTQDAGQSFSDVVSQARQAWSEVDPASFATTDEGTAEGTSPDANPEPGTQAAPAVEEPTTPETPVATQQETQLADAPDDDEDKVWNQYKDESARKKALRENKRYAAEMSRKAREAEAELTKLRSERQQSAQPSAPVSAPSSAVTTPPRPAAPAYVPGQDLSSELFEKTLTTLQESDQVVRYAMEGLGRIKQEFGEAVKEKTELTKAVSEDDKAIQEKLWAIDHYSKVAEKQPDEEAKANLLGAVAQFRRELSELKVERTSKVVRGQLLDLNMRELNQKWDIGRNQINQQIHRYLSREAEQAKEEESIQAQVQAADGEWNLGLQSFAKKHNLDADELKDAEDILLKDVRFELDRLGNQPIDIQGWLNGSAGDRVIAVINRFKQRSMKNYADAKRADAAQPAPPGRAAEKSEEKPSSRQSLEDATRAARAAISREFGG